MGNKGGSKKNDNDSDNNVEIVVSQDNQAPEVQSSKMISFEEVKLRLNEVENNTNIDIRHQDFVEKHYIDLDSSIFMKEFRMVHKEKTFLVKELSFTSPQRIKNNLAYWKEFQIVTDLQCRNTIKSKGYFIDEHNKLIYFIYEVLDCTLQDLIRAKELSFDNKFRILRNMLEIILFFHMKNIVLNDISIKNIRFTKKTFGLKLIKLENAVDLSREYNVFSMSNFTGEYIVHLSPEIMIYKHCFWQSDIWSLGVFIYLLFNDSCFFYSEEIDLSPEELKKLYEIKELPNVNSTNPAIDCFIISLLRIDYLQRPTIFQVIDTYNKLIDHFQLNEQLYLQYTNENMLEFAQINAPNLVEKIQEVKESKQMVEENEDEENNENNEKAIN